MKLPTFATYSLATIYFTMVIGQRTFLDNFVYQGRIARTILDQFIDRFRTQPNVKSQLAEKVQSADIEGGRFPCKTENFRSRVKPRSVHKLQPGDIDVVGALGDSLTAGFGALSTTSLDLVREYRGVSFTIGGEKTWEQYTTLPNILKIYNPNLIGYSLKSSNTFERASQFNVAEVSAISSDTPYMAKILLKRIAADKRVDLKEDWKLVTIFIGANDFCQFCYDGNLDVILAKHKRDLLAVLRFLRDNLPRTFVALVNPPYVDLIHNFTNLPPNCEFTQRLACPCVIGDTRGLNRRKVNELVGRWHELEEEIADSEEFDRDDFAVVNQPLFQDAMLPRTPDGDVDYNYFATDCFHFSQKGHALLAVALWNNILSPVGEKQKTIFNNGLKCPTVDFPYLYTRRNSNYVVIK